MERKRSVLYVYVSNFKYSQIVLRALLSSRYVFVLVFQASNKRERFWFGHFVVSPWSSSFWMEARLSSFVPEEIDWTSFKGIRLERNRIDIKNWNWLFNILASVYQDDVNKEVKLLRLSNHRRHSVVCKAHKFLYSHF